ncbi:NAD-dependent deacetylase sirtuin-2 [Schizopora paradoxa]|uniref:NAD-dependent deacetylase sirtuin-2 n=1 Tax=Schizopora paradoxa TaxID=27342 RepID=A0A0H2SCM6_9AGAM|nr:NAD-dependent deacetylase sirtuin-2 [Schizopora paradoxa]
MWKKVAGGYDVDDDDALQVLETLDLHGIAKYIKSDACKNIFIMAGAGISTSAGIPDFRSPDTGLYANLARLKLPYPEAVFDITFFRNNPKPFYTLAHELAPGKFRPTLTHSFIRLLAEKNYLHTCFTQNIDTLERRAGVPADKIIEAHGSFATQHCIKCKAEYPDDEMREKIKNQELPICNKCKGYVKPDIVFFGEGLPDEFFSSLEHLRSADLLIVMGTSLTVHPFASLTEIVDESCPRLLLNLDLVGGWGSRTNDVSCLMPCDDAVRKICELLGWEEELDALWADTANTVVSFSKDVEDTQEPKAEKAAEVPKEEVQETAKKVEKQAKVDLLEEFVGQLAEKIAGVGLDDEKETQPSQADKKEAPAESSDSNKPSHRDAAKDVEKSQDKEDPAASEDVETIDPASKEGSEDAQAARKSEPKTSSE